MEEVLLARVRALLAKAESTEFTEEADAFNRKAAELIAKYGIDEALLAASGAEPGTVQQTRITIDNPYSMEKALLLTVVAEAMRCRCIAHVAGRTARHCTVVGFTPDLDRVNLIYTSLLLQAVTHVTRQTPDGTAFGRGVSTVSYRKSWFTGFIHAVSTRLQDTERAAAGQAQSGAPSTALVLRDRSRLVEEKAVELFPSSRARTVMGGASLNGYDRGGHAGQRADIGGTRLPSHHRSLTR